MAVHRRARQIGCGGGYSMLTERYSQEFVRSHLIPRAEWRPFPPAGDRAAWTDLLAHPLNRERRAYIVGQAEAVLEGCPWPQLPATLYMEFFRHGNRSRYEGPYFRRRRNLASLVLGECFEREGRFLDEIVNGLWAICEEATWCVPAHARNPGDPLPSQEWEAVDLFAAETAMVLSEALYLVGDDVASVSAAAVDRVRREVQRRVIVPVETRDDFSRFSGHNNWTPWCASNVLGAAMYVLEDEGRLAALAHRLMGIVDRFIAGYGPDGGCDEGPGYWGVAAGALLLFLEHLHSRTGGAVSVYDEPLIGRMGRYIVDTHLAGPWFTNFADAPARMSLRRAVTYRYGDRVGADLMKDAALLSARGWEADGHVWPPLAGGSGGALGAMLRELFWIPADAEPQGLPNDLVNWFPDLQVLVVRESEILGRGLTLAAKAGHNGESHNHNDLGQFILLLDGQPAVVDVGVETYTRKTFSPERYTIWCIRSSGHNVPLVNGHEQVAGRDRRATDVRYTEGDGVHVLRMELSGAYPEEAGLRSARREIRYARDGGATVTVSDAISLAEGDLRVVVSLHCAAPVQVTRPGVLRVGTSPRALLAQYDPADISASVVVVPLMDARLRASWGERLWRVDLTYAGTSSEGGYSLRFRAED